MSSFSPKFVIGNIRIGTIEGASCVNMGNNFPSNFQSNKKHNQGFGSITGDNNSLEGLRSILSDSHIIDMITNSPTSEDIPEWVQEIIKSRLATENDEEFGGK
ncbi:hypothetical protein DS745_02795 [Anaerobacillus alkaliphilus]|uniref:Spore germination protein n=1 Tax=Anaerobacillus alkaliphilus TaxID=1548597 RepID=A0A4Q0VXQ6_9BACI|nr:hypothetical protein [Anaerobacillus alkaliphilus]RXJ04329.1 hypothetical protein DS745_02795 [Anaerobacillus alkaliphilus]